MATQFPSDTSQSPWAGPNGVTYEWNAKGYWEASGDNLSETYLSKTGDDTAAGAITFEEVTHIEGGLANGHDAATFELNSSDTATPLWQYRFKSDYFGTDSNTNSHLEIRPTLQDSSDKFRISSGTLNCQWNTSALTDFGANIASSSHLTGYVFNIKTSDFRNIPIDVSIHGYRVNRTGATSDQPIGGTFASFYTNIDSLAATNTFAFRNEGSAKSLLRGSLYIASEAYANFNNTGGSGWSFNLKGDCYQAYEDNNASGACLYLNRVGSTGGHFIKFGYGASLGGGQTGAGNIKLTSSNSVAFNETSDYRLKENIVDLPNAIDRVKAIKPYRYTFKNEPGVVHEGFLAHELAEHTVLAVSGEKDETEVFGTYTDPDGNVETNVSEPEAVPFGAIFDPQGTRDVYQSLDKSKIIPLLTKALQEALARIEQLESNTLQPVYATLADLPDASEHHGKTAHVHSEGALYFAHAGNWVKLQNA